VDYTTLPSRGLVIACLDTGDALAWQEFVRRFQKLIATVVFRTCARWGQSTPQVVDELVQETYLKLCGDNCRLLRSFQSTHDDAIFGYIKVLTANLVHDHFKAARAEKRGGSMVAASIDDELPLHSESLHREASAEIEKKVLIREIAVYLEGAAEGPNSKRDRYIFWLYYRAGMTAGAIASLPAVGLSTKGVETTILRLTRIVRQHLTRERKYEGPGSKSVEGFRSGESF
jgi:RNA polymerase sigma-70 factor, ECF subfamily